jgi:hypothetical protein
MHELLLIDLAMCAAVIAVSAAAVVMHWRRARYRPPPPAGERRGEVAVSADQGMPRREVAVVPGFGHHSMPPEPGTTAPAGPEQAAEAQISEVADPDPGSRGLSTEPEEPEEPEEPGEPEEPEEPEEPDEPKAPGGAVTICERISGYYQDADLPVADYLAARGWTEDLERPGRAAQAGAAPAAHEATAEPGMADSQPAARSRGAAA